jgi:hypothetical protein
MKIGKAIRRFFENGYRQSKGCKIKKTMSLKKIIKKLLT